MRNAEASIPRRGCECASCTHNEWLEKWSSLVYNCDIVPDGKECYQAQSAPYITKLISVL